ncbi:terminase small subunit [Vagococcus intermedius]|uniref:Terminase small subunit n=1 Tax=Vagococcus intermedius TaxID=2991418 RepID=A0AAF0I8W1_9ENTE|nr:terminase small subunit [Vagococcus intermedius]WEG74401.1 terminase small subunit [Vagococcus intermedius]WEG76522.1 terminase small subunit [Vagococcus intermedius]
MKDWELAYKDYESGMKYKEVADKYGKSVNTIKSWKSRYWNDIEHTTNKVATNDKKVCTQKEKVAHKEEVANEVVNDGTEDITDLNKYYGISEQQRRFADNYIENPNIYQSAVKAGYSETYANSLGYKLLGIIGIRNYINDRLAVINHNKIATQEEILRGLTRTFNREEEEHQVVTLRSKTEKWIPTGEDGQLKKMVVETEEPKVVSFPTRVSDSTRAADLLLKRLLATDEPQEFEDDGFLAALESEGEELWPQE